MFDEDDNVIDGEGVRSHGLIDIIVFTKRNCWLALLSIDHILIYWPYTCVRKRLQGICRCNTLHKSSAKHSPIRVLVFYPDIENGSTIRLLIERITLFPVAFLGQFKDTNI